MILVKKLYDFTYFIFYCGVIKREGDLSHVRAMTMQGITLTNILVFMFLLVLQFLHIDFTLPIYLLFLGLLIFLHLVINWLENKFYLKTGRYQRAIDLYTNKYSQFEKRLLGIFAVTCFLGSVGLFILWGVMLAHLDEYDKIQTSSLYLNI